MDNRPDAHFSLALTRAQTYAVKQQYRLTLSGDSYLNQESQNLHNETIFSLNIVDAKAKYFKC